VRQPLASVCIPAYGRPAELKEAILSALAQTVDDLEVVVCDDSGDLEGTVRAIGDARVRYFRNDTRLGMAGNWDRALHLARGRYRALLMDDDTLSPGFLARTVPVLDADAGVGTAFTNHYLQRGAKRTIRTTPLASGRHDAFLKTILLQQPVAVSAALMRAEAWEATRPLPDLCAADLVMHIRIAEAGWAFYYVDEPLMSYRVHAGQLSTQEQRTRDDLVTALSMFDFTDPECEHIRRRLLASAFLARAATNLKSGRPLAAQADVSAARALARPGTAREAFVAAIGRHRRLQRPAVWSWQAVRRTRRRRHSTSC